MPRPPICPLIQKPCTEHGCVRWVHETWVESATGEAKAGFGCRDDFTYKLLKQMVVEQIRTQATGDKVATTIARAATGLGQMALEAQQLRAVGAG